MSPSSTRFSLSAQKPEGLNLLLDQCVLADVQVWLFCISGELSHVMLSHPPMHSLCSWKSICSLETPAMLMLVVSVFLLAPLLCSSHQGSL